MKKILATLALSACAAAPAFAADCATTVEANDMMQFNTKSITVPKECKNFTVTLKHTGKMPKTALPIIDLPAPLSPTSPCTSPAPRCRA